MRFDRESYRKLYVRESAEDRMLPIFARGLRDYLLRHAQEDGTLLKKTKDWKDDLARALGVHRSETKCFKDALERLLENGFLTFEGGRLWITRFEEAQAAKTPGAKRTEAYRQRKASQDTSQETSPTESQEASQVTSQKASPLADETRREIADEQEVPPVRGAVTCPWDLWDRIPEQSKMTLETCMIPRWAQEQICKGYVAKTAGKTGNERTLDAWISTAVRVIQGDWGNPERRPRRPAPEEPPAEEARPRSYADIEREEREAEARARGARAAAQ